MAQSKILTIKYVVIDGEQYIADIAVIKRLNDLEQALFDEQTAHAKDNANRMKDIMTVAERVALNLNSGMQDSDICLAHSLNHFESTKDGQPVLAFKDEVMRRIILALQGKTYRGTEYR